MLSVIQQCVNLVNDNEGFTVVGWYKRGGGEGVINDQSIIVGRNSNMDNNKNINKNAEEDVQVDAGDISYYIVQIFRTNRDFLYFNIVLGPKIERPKN